MSVNKLMNRLLLIEDDIALGQGISMALRSGELSVTLCETLSRARELLNAEHFDLLILDINLPDGSGLELLGELRQRSSVPVILLTANDMELDIVSGLERGADDYITKPFSLAVLRARVNARLRRDRAHAPGHSTELPPYSFDFDSMVFRKNDTSVELSKTEQKLLRLLVDNRGTTLSRDMLIDRIWTDGAEYVDENALSVTVKRLRSKLGEECPIKTVYGIGYTWTV